MVVKVEFSTYCFARTSGAARKTEENKTHVVFAFIR
jgi:hypothetical protein